ncbi:putative amidoligase domain-containing protein [Bacillus benzoevorans]|uniref:ATP-grasp domain-containing protein n=1 Tax=Bacillus benzoevorans TaxID=1456 RepID=A0A7X0HR26_9BACI|nr:YheC/YheD family protein [Bacillus benzoevorans]MBB6445380.1 hypothetical protein [Bacillus benzoevorans]
MELINSPFFIGEDKELILQMLKTNNVQAVEIVDVNHCSYPIIGRKFGHHSGRDIKIIHSKEQSLEEDFDYFTKLVVIEHEYKLEVLGLDVVKTEEAIVHAVKNREIPIRTVQYGWEYEEIDQRDLPKEWLQLAVRAVYVTGMQHAYVKLGKLNSEKAIVLDVHPLPAEDFGQEEDAKEIFTIGADIEFMLSCDDELLPASEFFPLEGAVGCDERQIEQDSGEFALAEIRPEQSESPHELFRNIQSLIAAASERIPYSNISIRAGSMPFYGYQCGGHLHLGIKPSVKLLRVLDYFLAFPLAMLEQSNTSRKRRRTKHGGIGRFRHKPYGFEYLSLSSWMIKPEITLAVLCLAKLAVSHFTKLETPYLFHPLIQRAYYQGNQPVLKSIWQDIKKQIITKTDYLSYEKELTPFFKCIEEGYLLNEAKDIRKNWNLEIPNQEYERGLIIHVPKKIREKFHLSVGEDTFVCAGKSMSKATIRPYSFSFRNSKIIQLTPKLRENLSLPKEWNPKILPANGSLILGPILGILTNRPFERQGTYFQHISKMAINKQMLVYVFEPKDIIWEKQLIKGTTTEGEGLFPFPAVIYDRYFLTRKKQIKEIEEIRAKLQFIYQIPFINSPKLFDLTGDKWLSYQVLKEKHEEYLPDTCIYKQPSDIKEMIDLYGEVFIKPLGGALGKGIIQVMQNPSGLYWMNPKQQNFQPLGAVEDLTATLFPQIERGPYVLQEAVRRKKLNEHYVEIRVYMQKNGRMKWVRTGMVARLTNEGIMTVETEINRRASIVLSKLYPNPNERRIIKNQITKVTKSVVETIEHTVGTFGELAVDICIDQYDTIKILEVNAKPDNLFSQVNAYKLRNLAAQRLLNYATALSGFVWNDKEESGGFS